MIKRILKNVGNALISIAACFIGLIILGLAAYLMILLGVKTQ